MASVTVLPSPSSTSPPRPWVVAAVMIAISLAASAWPVATDWLVGRAAYDHLHYHLPAVQRFMAELPGVDLVDYASATTPGYHLIVAAVGRPAGTGPVGLRWIGLAFTLVLLGCVTAWASRRFSQDGHGWTGLAITLPMAASLYVYSSGVWLLPDNAGWLGVWAVLTLVLAGPIKGARWLPIAIALAALVMARQIHLWALAPVIVAAWLDACLRPQGEPTRDAMSLAEARAVLAPTRNKIIGATKALGAGLPAIVLLGALVVMWGGLVPPRFAGFHASTMSPAAGAFFLSLVAGFGAFFIGWWWRGFIAILRARKGLLIAALGVGALSALLPETSYSLEAGRYGALWSVGARLPVIADRSLLILALAPAGAVVLASWLTLVDVRTRWVLLAACAGFVAASSTNSIAGQRYYEPMVLMLCVLLAGSQPPTCEVAHIRTLRWLGPAVLGLVLAVLTTATLTRSGTMGYPEQPEGTKPLTAAA